MPYCIHCGVKLKHSEERCPLCQIPLEYYNTREYAPPLYPREVNRISIIKGQASSRDRNIIYFLRFTAFLTILVTSALDYYLNRGFTWSKVSSVSMLYLYTTITVTLHLRRNPALLYTYLNASLGLYLLVLDTITHGGKWFILYALPCFISLQLVSLIVMILFRFIKKRLLRTASIIVTVSSFLVLIDLITLGGITWSTLTTSVLTPTALFLIYLNRIIHLRENSP